MATEPKSLTADQLLAGLPDLTKAPQLEPVELPELGAGARVYVRKMTSAERDRFDESIATEDGKAPDNFRAKFVAACCCDEAGKLLFAAPQVAALGNRSPEVIQRVFRAGRKLNPPFGELVAAEKKGSDGAPSGGSPSASA